MTDISNLPSQACKNCKTEYTGYYCPGCGQKLITERYSLQDGASHIVAMILNFDRGLWPTIYNLVRNPGKVIRDYLNGITVPYFHPFRFLFLMVTINVLLMISSGAYVYVQESFSQKMTHESMPEITKELMAKGNSYFNILIALSMPILAFGSWLLFRKKGYNYAEHLIVVCYAYGLVMLVGILLIPIYLINQDAYLYASFIQTPLAIGIFTYFYLSWFKGKPLQTIFSALGAYIIWVIGFSVLIVTLLMSLLYYQVNSDPDFRERIKTEIQAE